MAAVSMDLRVRIFGPRQSGESTAEVAERFDVCPAFVRRLMQRHRETGSLAAKSARRGPKPNLAGHHEAIRTLYAEQPDPTAEEARERLKRPASRSAVRRALAALGLSSKKRRSAPPSRTAPPSKRRATVGPRRSAPGHPGG